MQAEEAAGRKTTILVWEDDYGSKCEYKAENVESQVLGVLFASGFAAMVFAWDDPPETTGEWVVGSAGLLLDGLVAWLAFADDDLVGAAVLVNPSSPGMQPKAVYYQTGDKRGDAYFVFK